MAKPARPWVRADLRPATDQMPVRPPAWGSAAPPPATARAAPRWVPALLHRAQIAVRHLPAWRRVVPPRAGAIPAAAWEPDHRAPAATVRPPTRMVRAAIAAATTTNK